MFAKDTLLAVSLWCPFCKQDTGLDIEGFEIKGIKINSYQITYWITHRKCQEDFQVNSLTQSIYASQEGEMIQVK